MAMTATWACLSAALGNNSIHDLYYELATHTTGSHAGLYNDENFGPRF